MRKKRLCAWLLSLLMMVSLLPTAVLAAGPLKVVRPPLVQDTYTFDGTGEQTVSEGETVYIPATPAKTGEHFTGWEDGGTTLTASSGKTVTAGKASGTPHAYTSQWETAYYVYFMASDAEDETEVVASAKVAPNGTAALPADYKPENGKVTGWKIKDTSTEFTAATKITADTVVVPIIEEGCWVTFNTMGGTEVESQFVAKNGTIDLRDLTSTRTGYTFAGWSETANGDKVKNSYTVTGSKTLYALWEGAEVNYTVVYWGENADDTDYSLLQATPDSKQAKTGTEVSSAGNAKPFPHFTYDASKGETTTVKADGSSVVNVYYSRNLYTMTFKGVTTGDCQLVEHQHSHEQCCTKRGLHLWCNTNKCPVGYEHSHRDDKAGDLVIKAKYDSDISYVWENDPIKSLIAQKYVFLTSFSDFHSGTVYIQKMMGQNITLRPEKWNNTSLKTWNYYLETLPGQDISGLTTKTENGRTYYLYHSASACYSNLTYEEDYVDITGFKQRDKKVPDFNRSGTADLYYLRNSYTLTLKNGDRTALSEAVLYQADISNKGSAPAEPPAGYSSKAQFMGWYAVSPENITGETQPYDFQQATMPAKDLLLFAYWKEPDIKLTIKTGGDTFEDTVAFNSVLSDTALYKAHQSIAEDPNFLYWVEDESGKPIAIDSALTRDTTIRAVMKSEAEQTYTVTYNEGASDSYQYRSGTVAEAKNYGGKTSGFLYWTDGTNNYYPGAQITVTGNVRLTAVFAEAPSEKQDADALTYYANFPDASPDKAEVTGLKAGTNYTVADYGTINGTTLPVREGYTFAKWNTQADGKGVDYSAGASFSLDNTGGNDLYARWTINQYTLTINYKYEDGSEAADAHAETLDYNAAYSVESPTVSGYTPDQLIVSGTMPAGNVEVTVTYRKNISSYTVTYAANGGSFASGEPSKLETVGVTGSHPLNYSSTFTPSHEQQDSTNVIFLGWSVSQKDVLTKSNVGIADDIAHEIITSVNVTENGATVYAVWSLDENNNGIPDVFEATITYKIVCGQWTNTDGEPVGTDPITAVFELYTKQDNYSWTATDKVLRQGNFPVGHQGNEGCTGQGWYRDTDTTTTTLVQPNTKVIDAVAGAETVFTYKYSAESEKTYTVVLHLDGGSYTNSPDGYTGNSDGTYQYTVSATDTVFPVEPVKHGFDLTGWSLTESDAQTLIGTGETFADLSVRQNGLTGDHDRINLYAVWEDSEPDDPVTILDVLNAHVFKSFQSVNSNSTTGTFTATATVSVEQSPVVAVDVSSEGEQVPQESDYAIIGTYTGTVSLRTGSSSAFVFTADGDVPLEPNTTYKVSVTEDTSKLPAYVTCAQPTVTFEFITAETSEADCDNYYITNTYKWVDDSRDDDDEDTYYFAIEKIDAQDSHTLNGAKFGLYLDGKQIATATSNRSGIAMFRVYESDYRKITTKSDLYYQELTAPEGYVVNSDKIDIEKSDLTTSQTTAEKNAETVRNYRSSTPDLLNDDDHFAYVIGYKDGYVRPYGLISRAETTTIFFRLLKNTVRDGNLLTSNTYTDVPDNYWANTAISTMTGLGIVQGRSSTTFDPQAPITRAQFAAICARFDTGTSSGTQTFSDISGHWAEKYIQRAAELGWIKGFEDGTFRPDTYITRAQAMTMINRVLNRIPEETSDLLSNMNVWPDCTTNDWFYLAVQEATNSHDFKHKAGNYETWTGMNADPNWTRYEN